MGGVGGGVGVRGTSISLFLFLDCLDEVFLLSTSLEKGDEEGEKRKAGRDGVMARGEEEEGEGRKAE